MLQAGMILWQVFELASALGHTTSVLRVPSVMREVADSSPGPTTQSTSPPPPYSHARNPLIHGVFT